MKGQDPNSLVTIRNNTTLKPNVLIGLQVLCLVTIRNNTTLKPQIERRRHNPTLCCQMAIFIIADLRPGIKGQFAQILIEKADLFPWQDGPRPRLQQQEAEFAVARHFIELFQLRGEKEGLGVH